jgi:glycosidase
MREFHVSRQARQRYDLAGALFGLHGGVLVADVAGARRLAARINQVRAVAPAARGGAPSLTGAELYALGILHEVFHYLVERYDRRISPGALARAAEVLEAELGRGRIEDVVGTFGREFPDGAAGPRGHDVAEAARPPAPGTAQVQEAALEELLLLGLTNGNPAAEPFRELFDDASLARASDYAIVLARLEALLDAGPPAEPGGLPLVAMLRAPVGASPTSLAGQLRYVRDRWAPLLGELGALLDRILIGLDVLAEEERALHLRFGGGQGGFGGLVETPSFGGLDAEPERFSSDSEWMPRVVLLARSTYVWLDQLSRRYGRDIHTLDAIPDEELDTLARWGVSGLWLIGLWERSRASRRIKQLRGNVDAVASAYSLDDYRIADDLGGESAFANLRGRAWSRGIRLASDMVPNHMGIDSRWMVEHPERFISLPEPPYPSYSFGGPDLSSDERVGIFLEDHYYDSSDAAVVFRRLDRWSGENRFVYHGNDGTSFPWNDTAQLDYLKAEVREAVIETILDVARRFPIIRFDAAMVLAKKHVERLWYPEPGAGGAIPSRAEHALPKAAFDAAMPTEFWRDVVDRVATQVPDTLLLAEAFWLLEGYFVRTLGMHRVYNSAFMHMLRDETNGGYRRVMKETLEFDPEILKRYVNFMSNPDEATAVEQFGKGDKYFGVATLLATLPGLPLLGHGQVEGFGEKYGMEFRRATLDERPDPWLVERHEREIFPLLHRRAQFAGADDFLLYDFEHDQGGVDENVFAYSNGRGPARSLVVYHNRFASTSGRIRRSVGYAVKGADGSKHVEQRSLAEGLRLTGGGDAFVAFRDARGGLEYLRSAAELRDGGLWLQLDAYRCHVFWEFRDIVDRVGVWRRLAGHLQGAGVPSLEDALRELELEPVHAAIRALAATSGMVELVRDGRPVDADAIEGSQAALARSVAEATGTTGDPGRVAGVAVGRLLAIGRRSAGDVPAAGSTGAASRASRAARAAAPDPLHPVRAAFADPWHRAVLAGWSILEPLGGLAPRAMVGPTSRAWFDELRLASVLAGAFRAAGLDEAAAWGATERVGLLLALPRPSNVGGRTTPERARRLVSAWLDQPDVRAFLRVNRWEGVEWFGRDEWRDLLDWALLLDAIDATVDDKALAAEAALILRLAASGEQSGYRVDTLRALVGPPARPRPNRPRVARP